ncbi:MAG: IS110 family transposase [Ferruginibacter sp.]
MKNYKHIFGVDVSKKTIDITYSQDDQFTHRKFMNDDSGMEELQNWLKEITQAKEDILFCMEATGLYCFPLTRFLFKSSIDTWIEQAIQIKRASGSLRGKNDKVDSQRIAVYAQKNLDKVRLWKPMDATLEKIKHLTSLRERLIETIKKLEVPVKEFEEVGDIAMAKILSRSIKSSLAAINKDLKNVELKIMTAINEDESLNKLFKLVTSVVGIGFVTAVNLLIHTNGFTIMKDARKLACYCGVAPFEYSSGTSIKGKTRVHFMANKKIKCNLHMASLTAVKRDPDLKIYYERKVAEGKNKMSVLNAVKNKLLSRVVAVVNKQQEYVKRVA